MTKRILPLTMVLLAAALAGCAVRDGHEEEPAPIWWPTFLYRPSTHPTEEEYNQTNGGAAVASPADAVIASSSNTLSHDVRAGWNPNVAEHPIAVVTSTESITNGRRTDPAAAATLYPNRGQAALAANSASLYPPTNTFNGGPAHSATVFARGPLAPTGYLGR